jgi:cell shape-determining protein MreC
MSDTTMTPEQFFDHLDEIFGCVDGYINHLQRIKELKEENERLEALKKEELEAIVKSDAGTMKLYGDIVSLMEKNTELQEENKKLKEKTIIYNILDVSYKQMSPNQKEWIDCNWKSIITGFAETLESQVPEEEV